MTHASLFTGIGGFDLASEWMGWENIFQVEKDKYCNKLLNQNFPHVQRFNDIKEFNGIPFRGAIDILTGGFPCQPYSNAGKRLGKEDERHLWPEMLRTIREVQPPWVVGENVYGLINWNGGLVFDEVQTDMEAEGYEVQAFLLPAAGVGAPHERYRFWFIAYSNSNYDIREKFRGCSKERIETEIYESQHIESRKFSRTNNMDVKGGGKERLIKNDSYAYSKGIQRRTKPTNSYESRQIDPEFIKRFDQFHRWEEFPNQPPICGGDDGISNRMDRIKGLGNAIVPQVALQIFKAIQAYENLHQKHI